MPFLARELPKNMLFQPENLIYRVKCETAVLAHKKRLERALQTHYKSLRQRSEDKSFFARSPGIARVFFFFFIFLFLQLFRNWAN